MNTSIADMSIEQIAILSILILFIIWLIDRFIRNPFIGPTIKHEFDISGRRSPDYEECIEEWLIENHKNGTDLLSLFDSILNAWDDECLKKIKRSFLFKSRRTKQYNKVKHKVSDIDYQMFTFVFYRIYHSNNIPSKKIETVLSKSNKDIIVMNEKLNAIHFATTTSKYNEANQRKLVTGQVRQDIKQRDNYTCQICGISKKFLDDLCPGLGDYLLFEIDHIQSVSQQGRSTESNLQCLCWRCNRAKSGNKTNEDVKRHLTYGIDKLKANIR